jgi:hypothetical protein
MKGGRLCSLAHCAFSFVMIGFSSFVLQATDEEAACAICPQDRETGFDKTFSVFGCTLVSCLNLSMFVTFGNVFAFSLGL